MASTRFRRTVVFFRAFRVVDRSGRRRYRAPVTPCDPPAAETLVAPALYGSLQAAYASINPAAPFVLGVQHAVRRNRIHVTLRKRVQDGQVKPRSERRCKERGVHQLALRKPEAHVRNAQHRLDAQTLFDQRNRAQDFARLLLVRGSRHHQAVDCHVAPRDASALRLGHNALRNGEAPFRRRRNAVFVKREPDHRAPVFLRNGQDRLKAFALPVYGVDERFARIGAHGSLHRRNVGRVDLKRQRRNGGNAADRLCEHDRLVQLGQSYVHVEDVGACFLLRDRLPDQVIVVTRTKRLFQAFFCPSD